MQERDKKIVIYQVFTRLFGNKVEKNKPWGSKEENGIGIFADFTDRALEKIYNLGITHIWLTGVLHHAVIGDYSEYGISGDHPDVVKGRAGSPYAIRDYYNVNPDLATDPSRRMEEFEDLVEGIHQKGMKVIIDIVPNHVARQYKSLSKPEGTKDFGEDDNTNLEYARNNDFYYIPGKSYQNPDWSRGKKPLNGEKVKGFEEAYQEFPAKWTGNGSRKAQPDINDWYETVKISYGVRPDGSKDFPEIPWEYIERDPTEHFDYWENKDLPGSWSKWREITSFWLEKGVDGFRYDMAELVPVEFWSYLNSSIKKQNPDALLIAEVYDPNLYEGYIGLGKMDLLYDKVELYDTLRNITEGSANCHDIFPILERNHSFSHNLLHFLENHDEHRIATPEFAGKPEIALPAMVLSTCIDKGGVMIYFGQEVGEDAQIEPGFASPSRTSIFDYIGVEAHQKWMNNGHFDGGQLSSGQRLLREYYMKLLSFARESKALTGTFYDLHRHNVQHSPNYDGEKLYAFARWKEEEKILLISNFDQHKKHSFRFSLYYDLIRQWKLDPGEYSLYNHFDERKFTLQVQNDFAYIDIKIEALESLILKLIHK